MFDNLASTRIKLHYYIDKVQHIIFKVGMLELNYNVLSFFKDN